MLLRFETWKNFTTDKDLVWKIYSLFLLIIPNCHLNFQWQFHLKVESLHFYLFGEAIDEKGDHSHFQTVHQTSTSSGLNNLFGPKLQARPCSSCSCAPPDTSSPSKGGAGSCLTQWYRDQSQAISRNKDGGVGHRQDIQPGLDYCSPYIQAHYP